MCPYYPRTIRSYPVHVWGVLTGRKWVKRALEVMEVSRFWDEVRVGCVIADSEYDTRP